MFSDPIKGLPYTFAVELRSQANQAIFQANPTLAAGDVKVSKDGGAFSNIGTLPTVTPASGRRVAVTLSASEMSADEVTVQFVDASGAEWCDLSIHIPTASGIVTGGTVSDGSPGTQDFMTSLSEVSDDHYNGMILVFITGNLTGQARKIGDYNGTTKEVSVVNAFTEAPADTDRFVILGRIE